MLTIMVFNEEDRTEMTMAQKGREAHLALLELDELLRKTAKYGEEAESTPADVWRKTLHEVLDAHGIRLEDIP